MADLYAKIIGTASNYLYSYVLIILLVGGGIYFTIRTKGVQLRYLLESIRVILEPSDKEDESISAFQALMVSTASRVGTGNIAGISTAICFGGPGAIFWMWMTAILGSATAFVESTLAQIYKRRAEDGSCYGGPSYYIEAVLKKRWLGVLYAIFMILTYMVGFNLVASFNVAVTEQTVASYLDTAGIPDPDLLIRTSGEIRLSNYLLWQLAYSEIYITDCLWPDFNRDELIKAIEQFNQRDRRFGGVKA